MEKYTHVLVLIAMVIGSMVRASADVESVKVFILAGQSNMEGKAQNTLLDHQATDPNTADLFSHLRAGDQWIVRDDVFIKFLDRKGSLTIKYGSPGRTGIELEFRKDLDVPNLPFVIAAIGTNGSKEATGGCLAVRTAQLAMNEVPEFAGNVKAFRTDVLVDKAAEALIDGWQNHVEAWSKVGSDRPYHYLGSAIWYGRIGRAFGDAMLDLKKNQ